VIGAARASLVAVRVANEVEADATPSTNSATTELASLREEGYVAGGGWRDRCVPVAREAGGTAPAAVAVSTADGAAVVARTWDGGEAADVRCGAKGGWREDCVRGANEARGTASVTVAEWTADGAAVMARTGDRGEAVDVTWGVKGRGREDCVRGANEARGTASSAVAASTAGGAADGARTRDEGAFDGKDWGGRGTTGTVDGGADLAAGGNDHTVAIRRENGVKRWAVEPAGTAAVAIAGDRLGAPSSSPVTPYVRWFVLILFGRGASV